MNTYVINICVDTKTTDIYEKVAVNRFPLLITCNDEDSLKEILSNEAVKNHVKQLISKHLYQNAEYCIVKIDELGSYSENSKMKWDLKDITKIEWET